MQAMELEDQLQAALEMFDVEVLKGRDYVQVRPKNVNKGVFVREVLGLLNHSSETAIDFVLCMGDDTTDESMFEAAQEYVKEDPCNRETVVTGIWIYCRLLVRLEVNLQRLSIMLWMCRMYTRF